MRRVSPFKPIKTWKTSKHPNFEMKNNRILEIYDIADGKVRPRLGEPDVVLSALTSSASQPSAVSGATLGRARRDGRPTIGAYGAAAGVT